MKRRNGTGGVFRGPELKEDLGPKPCGERKIKIFEKKELETWPHPVAQLRIPQKFIRGNLWSFRGEL